MLGYYVFVNQRGGLWLQDDEQSWGPFGGAAEFAEADLANDIAKRETNDEFGPAYVFGLLESAS